MTSGGGVGGSVDVLYIDVKARLDAFEAQLRQMQQDAANAGQNAGAGAGGGFADKIKSLGGAGITALTALATAGGLAIGAALIGGLTQATNLAYQQAEAVRGLQAQFGLTAERAKELGEVATSVFGDNFGESIADASAAVTAVRKNLGEMSDVELKKVTEGALAIKDVFGVEVADSTAAASSLMKQFGLTAQQASDFVAKGFQAGLPEDFLDSITEYSTQFANGGASASEFFSILQTGAAQGALGTDKAADAFKEFRVRIQDGSKSTAAGLKQLGIDSDDLAKRMASGQVTAADAFGLVLGKLKEQTDSNTKMQAGVALLGTQYEDLGQKSVDGLSLTKTSLKDIEGATASLNVKYDSLGALFGGVSRQIQVALIPIGKEVLHLANDALPYVKDALRTIMPVLTSLVQAIVAGFGQGKQVVGGFMPYIQQALAFFAPLLKSIGPLFSSLFGLVKTLWETVLRPTITAIAPVFQGVFQVVAGVLTYAVQLVTGVVKAITALFRGDMKGAVDALRGIFEAGVTAAVRIFRGLGSSIFNVIKAIAPQMAEAAGDIIRGLIHGLENGGKQVIVAAQQLAGNIVGPLKQFLGIQSPSKVTTTFGQYVGEGLVNGMLASQGDVGATARGLGAAITAGLSAGTGDTGSFGATVGKSLVTGLKNVPAPAAAAAKAVAGTGKALADARAELEKTIAFDKYTAGLKALTSAQLSSAQAAARAAGDSQKYGAIQTELAARQDVVNAGVQKRVELEKGIKTDAWTAGLKTNSTAHLLQAQAIARASGDAEKYSAITGELARRTQEAAAATQKHREVLKAAADQLAANRKAIQDSLNIEVYTQGLKNYTDQQLVLARNNAARAGDQGKFNLVLSEQKSRLDEAAAAAESLYEALSKASGVRFENTANAADSAFRQSFGVGDAGLIKSLAATTGLSIDSIRNDVKGVLADLGKYAPEAAAVISRVYADELTHRQDVADRTSRQRARDLQADLEYLASVKGLRDQEFRDANYTADYFQDRLADLFGTGQNPEDSGFVKFLQEVIRLGGKAGDVAQGVLNSLTQAEDTGLTLKRTVAVTPTPGPEQARQTASRPELSGPVDALPARPPPVGEVLARGQQAVDPAAQAKADQAVLDRQKAFRDNLEKIDFEKYKSGLKGLSDAELQTGLGAAQAAFDVDKYNAILGELATRTAQPLNATVQVLGIETGIKALDLYKSALQGVASVISQTFEDLVSGSGSSAQDVVKNMALMALGIVKQVAVAIAAYEAQAIALAIISGASFNFVQAGLALAAAAAVAGIVSGLESRLGGSSGASRPVTSTTPASTSGTTAVTPDNSSISIPNAAVSVIASPAFVAEFGGHVDRFGKYIGRLVEEGIHVSTDRSSGGSGGSSGNSLAWDLGL